MPKEYLVAGCKTDLQKTKTFHMVIKMTPGKQFEKDFQSSAEKVMATIRLKDPAASFGKDSSLRFSPRNMCDFICYRQPHMYLFELKSFAGTSVPFKSLVSGKTDNRIRQMADLAHSWQGAFAFVVFNCRKESGTFAVQASDVINFMDTSSRKSIPFEWIMGNGLLVRQFKKRIHWSYDLSIFTDSDNQYFIFMARQKGDIGKN